VDQPRLTPDEDAELRVLHGLRSFGAVATSIGSRYERLRDRDRRDSIREPMDEAVVQPLDKSAWGPNAPIVPAENPPADLDPMDLDEIPMPPLIVGPQATGAHEDLPTDQDLG